jgi:cell division initiation protein
MELVPKTLREVEFREKLRGYNQDDVDDFLEQVAVGLEALQEQLRQANERGGRTDDQRGSVPDDDPVRRTLVLAQRTADMAIKEAHDEAAEIVAAAEARARATVSEADEAATLHRETAETAVRAEVQRLERARETLLADITALEEHLERARGIALSSLGDAMRWLEDHLHDLPRRPELETDPAAVAEAVAPPPAFTATVLRPSADPEPAGSGGIGSTGNGAVGASPADASTLPGQTAAATTPVTSEGATSVTASLADDDGPAGAAPESSEASSPDDSAPDATAPEPTQAFPTIGPGQRSSGLFDAEEELGDEKPPPSRRGPKPRL